MAIRRGISARNQALLNRDLSYGTPVLYRKVPGRRAYYDPKHPTNDPVTEDYVYNVYKPRLSIQDRDRINEAVRAGVKRQRNIKYRVADTWSLKQRALGNSITDANQALKQAEFNDAYHRLRAIAYEAHYHNRLEDPNRGQYYAVGSDYHNILVEMGRRTGLEDFPIGESPKHATAAGGYIESVVRPYLESLANEAQAVEDTDTAYQEMIENLQASGIDTTNMNDRQIKTAARRAGFLPLT